MLKLFYSVAIISFISVARAEPALQEINVPVQDQVKLESIIEGARADGETPDVVFISRTMFGGGLIELETKDHERSLAPYGGFTFEAGAKFLNALEVGGFIEFNDIAVLVLTVSAGIYSSLELGDLIYIKGRFYTIPAALSFQAFSYWDGIAGGAVGFNLASGARAELFYERNLNIHAPGSFGEDLAKVQFFGVRFMKEL